MFDPNSCEALPNWAATSGNLWTGLGTASNYAAFSGLMAGLTLTVLVVALQADRPRGGLSRWRDQEVREQTLAVGLTTVFILTISAFLYAQATGDSTCAAWTIDLMLQGVPLGAGATTLFVLVVMIADLLGLRGLGSEVAARLLLAVTLSAAFMNAYSAALLLALFKGQSYWFGVPLIGFVVIATSLYASVYRHSRGSTRSRHRPLRIFCTSGMALGLAAIAAQIAAGQTNYQDTANQFPGWPSGVIVVVTTIYGALALWAAPLSASPQARAAGRG